MKKRIGISEQSCNIRNKQGGDQIHPVTADQNKPLQRISTHGYGYAKTVEGLIGERRLINRMKRKLVKKYAEFYTLRATSEGIAVSLMGAHVTFVKCRTYWDNRSYALAEEILIGGLRLPYGCSIHEPTFLEPCHWGCRGC